MTLGLGIVSFWFSHAREICARARSMPGVRLVAAWDDDSVRGGGHAREMGIEFVPNLDELLGRADIDAVAVCGQPYQQAELTLRSVNAGKHVLVEKPMALTLSDARSVAGAALSVGVQVMPAHNLRFNPAAQYVKSVVDSGVLGSITRARRLHGHYDYERDGYDREAIMSTWKDPLREGRNSLFHSGSHGALWFDWMFGMPRSVTCSTWASLPGYGVEDNATVLLRYDNFVGSLETSETLATQHAVVEIHGTRGVVIQLRGDLPAIRARGSSSVPVLHYDCGRGWLVPDLPNQFIRHEPQYSSAGQFFEALLHDREVPTTVHSGVRSIAVLEAAVHADAVRKEVNLDDVLRMHQ